jgi:hypothetical protein
VFGEPLPVKILGGVGEPIDKQAVDVVCTDYVCSNCGAEDKLRTFTNEPINDYLFCFNCHKMTMTSVISVGPYDWNPEPPPCR